jgi:membrane protease YdiL (CAAX protease family)
MIKIFDFIYYFMFQLNRRGYKTGNYDTARFAVAFVIYFVTLVSSIPLLFLIEHYFDIKVTFGYIGIFSVVFALIITYPLTKKFYGPKGSRKWVVSHYDKTTNIRKQNSVLLVILLNIVLFSYLFFCAEIKDLLKEYWGIAK